MIEHFQDTCGGEIGWLSGSTAYTAFAEGWALYAENPLIAHDTDVYEDEPLYKYGMLKSQASNLSPPLLDTFILTGLWVREPKHMSIGMRVVA